MVHFVEGFVSICYRSNSPLHAWHLPFSLPIMPIIRIFPMVPHFGHSPVVMFFGPLALGFTVFLLTINGKNLKVGLLSLRDRLCLPEGRSMPPQTARSASCRSPGLTPWRQVFRGLFLKRKRGDLLTDKQPRWIGTMLNRLDQLPGPLQQPHCPLPLLGQHWLAI